MCKWTGEHKIVQVWLASLEESLALEVAAYNIWVMTIFLGRVATQMWHDYDSNYYERNKNRMFSPRKVAAKHCRDGI